MADVQQVLGDPNFKGLNPVEQMKVLRKVDPNFAGLDAKVQAQVVMKLNQSKMETPEVAAPKDRGYLKTLIGDVASLPGMAMHPVKTLQDATAARRALGPKSEQAFKEGHQVEGAGYRVASILPFVGPAMAQTGEELGEGRYGEAAAHATELFLPSVLGKGARALKPYATAAMTGDVLSDVAKGATKMAGGYALAKTGPVGKFISQIGGYDLAKAGIKDFQAAATKINDIVNKVQEPPAAAPAPTSPGKAPAPAPRTLVWAKLPDATAEEFEQGPIPEPKLPSGRKPGQVAKGAGESALQKPKLSSEQIGGQHEHAFDQPEGETGAYNAKERYSKANRTVKARALARYLKGEKISLDDARLKDPNFWKQAAKDAGVNEPSPQTIQQSLEEFLKLTAK
jgi:hypothetical protein